MRHGVELEVDGSVFRFPTGWQAQKYDEWSLTASLGGGLGAKACDIVATDGRVLYLIEAKDYTYPVGTRLPPLDELASNIALKGLHTLAGLHAGARIDGVWKDFCKTALNCDRLDLCFSVELPEDSGYRLRAPEVQLTLADLINRKAKPYLGHRSLVVSHSSTNVRWTASWSPARRALTRKP